MYVCLVFILPGCHVSFGFCPCARDLTFAITMLRLLWTVRKVVLRVITVVPKPGTWQQEI